jgi:hypothetical protein
MVERDATVTWLPAAARGTAKLPATLRYVGLSRFPHQQFDGSGDIWSVVCRFPVPPAEQGNPSVARVQFLVAEAPHEWLTPGARFELWEGPTAVAVVEVQA